MALMVVILALVVITVIGVMALKGSILGQKIAGNRSQKMSLDNLARSALEIIQQRMHDRMNLPAKSPDGDDWDWANDEPKKFVVAADHTPLCDGSAAPGSCHGWLIGGTCYHGYRLQNAENVDCQVQEYAADFKWEGEQSPAVGVFKPCLTSNNCTSDESNQWTAKYVSDTPRTSGEVDILNDGINDFGHQIEVQVEAFDSKSGKKVVVRADILLVAPSPSAPAAIPMYANVISRMSLMSGFIKGSVAQILDPAMFPHKHASVTGADLGPVDSYYFNIGEFGMLHWSCKKLFSGLFGQQDPCLSQATVLRFDRETNNVALNAFYANMQVGGVVTNLELGSRLFPQVSPPPAPGLVVDDGDGATGDTNNGPLPDDVLINQDPTVNSIYKTAIVGRDRYGAMPTPALQRIANGTLAATGNCIDRNTGTTDAFTPTNVLDNDGTSDHIDHSNVVLKPDAGCSIEASGTFVIDGDLIIAGNGQGAFKAPSGIMDATLFATGNIYILNDINVANGPPEIIAPSIPGSDRAYPNGFRLAGGWQASTGCPLGGVGCAVGSVFDKLALMANGHIIVGNLANSNNFAHAMTYANTELNYFNIDMTGDGVGDLIVPDGYRPSSTPRNLGGSSFQVQRDTCAEQSSRGFEVHCNTQAIGLLPAGSSLVDQVYNFAFAEESGTASQAGYGYVRNSSDTTPGPATPGRAVVTDPDFESGPPINGAQSDLFRNGWISTDMFRQLAGGTIVPANPQLQHDSFDPDYVNRAHYIAAKLYAGGTILGLGSFDDKYNLPSGVPNPDSPTGANFYSNTSNNRSLDLLKRVTDTGRYDQRCTSAAPGDIPYLSPTASGTRPSGIDIFGGVYAPYINILSTSGLCVYRDNREVELGEAPILVIPGPAYQEDILARP